MQPTHRGLLDFLTGKNDGEEDAAGSVLHLEPPDQGTDNPEPVHESAEPKGARPRRSRHLVGEIRADLIGPRSKSHG